MIITLISVTLIIRGDFECLKYTYVLSAAHTVLSQAITIPATNVVAICLSPI